MSKAIKLSEQACKLSTVEFLQVYTSLQEFTGKQLAVEGVKVVSDEAREREFEVPTSLDLKLVPYGDLLSTRNTLSKSQSVSLIQPSCARSTKSRNH